MLFSFLYLPLLVSNNNIFMIQQNGEIYALSHFTVSPSSSCSNYWTSAFFYTKIKIKLGTKVKSFNQHFSYTKIKTRKGTKVKLHINIRNKLQMLCAMRRYSQMKGGKGKIFMQQHEALYTYYHGNPPSSPSQIKMVCKGTILHSDICENIVEVTTSKKNNAITEFVLRKDLHHNPTRRFRTTREIHFHDL